MIRTIREYLRGRRKVTDMHTNLSEAQKILEGLEENTQLNYRYDYVHSKQIPYRDFRGKIFTEYEHIGYTSEDHGIKPHEVLASIESELSALRSRMGRFLADYLDFRGQYQIYRSRKGERHYVDLKQVTVVPDVGMILSTGPHRITIDFLVERGSD